MAKKEEKLKTISEIALFYPEIQPSLVKLESVRKQLAEAALQCMKIKVTDDTSLSVCENNLSKINDLVTTIELVRKSEKEPFFKRGQAIDAAAAYVVSLPKEAIEHLKEEKKAYILEQDRKKQLKESVDKIGETLKAKVDSFTDIDALDKYEEAIKNFDYLSKYGEMSEEAIRIKDFYSPLFDLKRKELEAIKSGTPEEIEAIHVAQEDLTSDIQKSFDFEENSSSVISLYNPKKVRRPWTFELVDLSKVPKEWLILDESKVKEFLKTNKDDLVDGKTINGIKFFKDITITA